MTHKRKYENVEILSSSLNDDLNEPNLLVSVNHNEDSTDDENEDSDFHDDMDDEFYKLNLDSDEDDENNESNWEDIEEEQSDEADGDESDSSKEDDESNTSIENDAEIDSAFVESSHTEEENEPSSNKDKTNKKLINKNNLSNNTLDNKTDISNKSTVRKKRHRKKSDVSSSTNLESASSSNLDSFQIASTSVDEYIEDSSDEEDLRNTIGNIPINWYDEYPHLGYGLDSLPIIKPAEGDKLDKFLDKLENPDYYRTVFDKQTGQQVKLSDEHLDFINRVMGHKVPDRNYDLYQPFHDLYSHEVMEMPLSGRPEHKRSFIPSKAERQEVVRLATLIKRGLLRRRKLGVEEPKNYYDIWKPRDNDDEKIGHITDHISAPKMPLPGHKDSYNPPPEYLVKKTDYLIMKGRNVKDKELFDGMWRKFNSIREIPMYPKTVQERFERLLDLYITPRKRYQKVVAKAKDFLPNLPDKKDLRPYPTMEGVVFKGHRSIIRTISVHPGGKYLASGSDDHTVRIWEISTGRCLRTFEVEEAPKTVSWNPNPKLFLLGVAMGKLVVFMNPENHLLDKIVVQQTNSILKEEVEQGDYIAPQRINDAVTWRKPTEQEYGNGYRLVLEHFREVKQIVWHKQGDYFATVIPEGDHRSVLMHQLGRWRTQVPFSKNKGRIQTVAFHPKLPQLFVVTQSHIRVYDLQKQGLLKKIQANSRWVSCIDVHPGGEHFIIGGYDRRVNWFEMEYTKRPHLMRYHVEAVRSCKYHRKYPLYASCSDDGRVVVCHGMVYDDWLKDPLIVPLKQLKGHKKFDDLYVLDLAWHPFEPYLLTAGADATIRLWH